MNKSISFIVFSLFFVSTANAAEIETKARNAILMDYDTGAYLMTKEHGVAVPPASMSKLMTVYILFDKIKAGELSEEDEFSVSENAWRKGGAASGGSTMFLPLNSKVKVGELLKGIIIQSGNDACIVAAENVAGSEEAFADLMNAKAKELGLGHSHFVNSTGLPHPEHRMSVEDLANLSKEIIDQFPEHYYLFSEKSFVFNGITQGNRNPLLYSVPGADGLKTGHTEEAGFSLTASVKQGGRRLILSMTGMDSQKERGEETEKLVSWGFREFSNYTLLKGGRKIAEVPVWYGKERTVDLVVPADAVRTMHRAGIGKVKMTAVYNTPVKAPVGKGDKLGSVRVETADGKDFEVDLVADRDVGKLGFFGRMAANFRHLLGGGE